MDEATREHLAACAACNRLHKQFEKDFGPERNETQNEARARGWTQGREDRWKRAPEVQTAQMTESPAGAGAKRPGTAPARMPAKTPARPPDHVCQCGRSKQPQYLTCFQCSGLKLCGECGENYHSVEYETCYECSGHPDW